MNMKNFSDTNRRRREITVTSDTGAGSDVFGVF